MVGTAVCQSAIYVFSSVMTVAALTLKCYGQDAMGTGGYRACASGQKLNCLFQAISLSCRNPQLARLDGEPDCFREKQRQRLPKRRRKGDK
jgi:hypothetical protein